MKITALYRQSIAFWMLFHWCSMLLAETELPPGVPNPIGENGKWKKGAMMFTTEAYQKEALLLLLREANQVAKAVNLSEKLPIRELDLSEVYIVPFGLAYVDKSIGTISTSNYTYCVSRDNKLCYLVSSRLDETMPEYGKQFLWPTYKLDTNSAFSLATQWLAALSMDTYRLNRDLHVIIETNTVYFHNPAGKFVPVYDIRWCRKWKPKPGIFEEEHSPWDTVVFVQLLLPTKKLLQLHVEDAKYNLRNPLVFTNLPYLLSQTNVSTNTVAPRKP